MEEEFQKEILDQVINNKSIHISRVPHKTKMKFIELANNEFEGDYGMCLKWLVDGIMDANQQAIIQTIAEMGNKLLELEHDLSLLREEQKAPVDVVKKMLSGAEIKVK